MVLSSSERDDLVLRVERALARAPGPGRARPALVRAAVDATLGALAARARAATPAPASQALHSSPPAAASVVAILAATVPDLASRTRRALESAGVRPAEMAAAHAGRHAVVTLRVSEGELEAVRQVANDLGASCAWREGAA